MFIVFNKRDGIIDTTPRGQLVVPCPNDLAVMDKNRGANIQRWRDNVTSFRTLTGDNEE